MLNTVIYIGRLIADPELRQTKGDVPVTSFRIAVKRDFAKKGEPDTDFFDVIAWRSTAEFICKHFRQGKLICLRGRNHNREWKDKHEQKRVTTELHADQAYFVGDKDSDDSNGSDHGNPFEDGAPTRMPSPFDD